jgi:hypothetical protein
VAIATFAAVTVRPRIGLSLVGMAWITNQIIGFSVLKYPTDVETFGWGAALAVAAVAAFACTKAALAASTETLFGQALAFVAAFVAFESALYCFGALTSASSDAFTAATVGRVLAVNLASFAALLVAERALGTFALQILRNPLSPLR